MTAPYDTIGDTSTVELSSEVMKKTGAATVTKSTKTSHRKIKDMTMKEVSRVFDI